MIDRGEILRCFCLLSGFSPEEGQEYASFIETAAADLEKRLRAGADDSDQRLCYAAAAAAYYRYCLMDATRQGGSTFKAGDVSVSRQSGEAIESARALRDDGVAAVSDLVSDTDFIMRTV